ncbi:MAG: peptidoglycan bridge formation glycyltransferase FemA/FemB family protein [Anaerolineaceae bacterium]|nr:peptidoglycan bridge formation glycyltransferase FemA/FemB family protein [Anaerolineaceae bacterium]
MRALEIKDAKAWDALISELPQPHILQTWEWGLSKERNGWKPIALLWEEPSGKVKAAAMLLLRQVSLMPGLHVKVLYCPKGPVMDWHHVQAAQNVLADLEAYTKKEKAIFLKIDPDVLLGTGQPGTEGETFNQNGEAMQNLLRDRKWRFSQDQIQFRNSVFIDLQQSEEDMLATMKQKTRYNIRLASRKGVLVRSVTEADLPALYRIYAATGVRDGFVVRHEGYYTELWQSFMQAGMAHGLLAEYEGKTIAALILFHFAGVARYMFGMSLELNRELMPNYLLQWEAIKLAKKLGCHTYDFWGAPDEFNEEDPLWGVYRFKEGFNGKTVRHIGAWDFVARPALYKLYSEILPKILDIARSFGKAQNRKKVAND